MEMHQVRYFLATVSELNFTKAAEKSNVTQPSLTRAIKQLEDELGGDLFRRERPQAQLTELGQRMYPLLKQCYESALGARSLASAIKSGEVGTLRLALSRTINLEPLTRHLAELNRLFNRLELKLLRGTGRRLSSFSSLGRPSSLSPRTWVKAGSVSIAGRSSPRSSDSSSTPSIHWDRIPP
jgi:DNA-binding transcriptional LysR family regulator